MSKRARPDQKISIETSGCAAITIAASGKITAASGTAVNWASDTVLRATTSNSDSGNSTVFTSLGGSGGNSSIIFGGNMNIINGQVFVNGIRVSGRSSGRTATAPAPAQEAISLYSGQTIGAISLRDSSKVIVDRDAAALLDANLAVDCCGSSRITIDSHPDAVYITCSGSSKVVISSMPRASIAVKCSGASNVKIGQ